MTQLPAEFLTRPLSHRGYHDVDNGRPETSRAAIVAAINTGYGIEIDVQISADRKAMVFHDDILDRLTGEIGLVNARAASDLGAIPLLGGAEGIPTLPEVLDLVNGQVPLLIEIKDQDGALGENIGDLEASVAQALQDYAGAVAVMSFNPHSVADMAKRAPNVSRGLVTCGFAPEDWPNLPPERGAELATIPDYDRVRACFISHDVNDLANPRVHALKERGAAILCWTVRSIEQEMDARAVVDNITFEGYGAMLP